MQFPSTLLESPGGLPRGYSAVRGETVQSLRGLPFPRIVDRLAGFLDSVLFSESPVVMSCREVQDALCARASECVLPGGEHRMVLRHNHQLPPQIQLLYPELW